MEPWPKETIVHISPKFCTSCSFCNVAPATVTWTIKLSIYERTLNWVDFTGIFLKHKSKGGMDLKGMGEG